MLDGFGFAKAMAFSGVQVEFVRDAPPPQSGDDRIRLGPRRDLVFLPLEDDEQVLDFVGMEFAGSRPVDIGGLGQRPSSESE